ncbi:MAG: hypothetical protein VR68_05715 [Peptococcaceae bacterium BRH_c4a]|nr:MAG: hypothetical protein VR68_05715 [Peptococcaceae bacterium BRH_c4a]
MFPKVLRFHLKGRIYDYKRNSSTEYISSVTRIDKGEILIDNPFRDILLGELKKTLPKATAREAGGNHGGDRAQKSSDRGLYGKDREEEAGRTLVHGPVKEDKRRFVRVKRLLRIQYAIQPETGAEPLFKKAGATNISAGGMELEVDEYTGQGSRIILQFILPAYNSYRKLNVLSVVTRTVPPAPGVGKYLVGVEFVDIKKTDHDIIIRHIMGAISYKL